jgi:hypothetical protein
VSQSATEQWSCLGEEPRIRWSLTSMRTTGHHDLHSLKGDAGDAFYRNQ